MHHTAHMTDKISEVQILYSPHFTDGSSGKKKKKQNQLPRRCCSCKILAAGSIQLFLQRANPGACQFKLFIT